MPIFPTRALLQINFAGLVEYQDVNGPMPQVIPMHFGAACVSQYSIIFIDDWKLLVLCQTCVRGWRRRDEIRQSNPLQQ